jgi:hypothetical protein
LSDSQYYRAKIPQLKLLKRGKTYYWRRGSISIQPSGYYDWQVCSSSFQAFLFPSILSFAVGTLPKLVVLFAEFQIY